MSDVKITIVDRQGKSHEVLAPTDMAMNLMEVVRSYELAEEGTIGVCGGMAMCASCQCYIQSDHVLPEMSPDEDLMLAEAFYVQENSISLSCWARQKAISWTPVSTLKSTKTSQCFSPRRYMVFRFPARSHSKALVFRDIRLSTCARSPPTKWCNPFP